MKPLLYISLLLAAFTSMGQIDHPPRHGDLDSIVRAKLRTPTFAPGVRVPLDSTDAMPAKPSHLYLIERYDSIARAGMPAIPIRARVNPWTSYNWLGRIVPAGMHFMAGASNGLLQTLLFHYDRFEARHPDARRQFWDPSVSWENKYKRNPDGTLKQPLEPAFWLSRTALAWYTDGYHATGTMQYAFTTVGIVIDFNRRQHWLHYLFDAIVYTCARNAGFHAAYTLYYRP